MRVIVKHKVCMWVCEMYRWNFVNGCWCEDTTLKSTDTLLPLYERAVRNCPWSAELWIGQMQVLEHSSQAHDQIVGKCSSVLFLLSGNGGVHQLLLWMTKDMIALESARKLDMVKISFRTALQGNTRPNVCFLLLLTVHLSIWNSSVVLSMGA